MRRWRFRIPPLPENGSSLTKWFKQIYEFEKKILEEELKAKRKQKEEARRKKIEPLLKERQNLLSLETEKKEKSLEEFEKLLGTRKRIEEKVKKDREKFEKIEKGGLEEVINETIKEAKKLGVVLYFNKKLPIPIEVLNLYKKNGISFVPPDLEKTLFLWTVVIKADGSHEPILKRDPKTRELILEKEKVESSEVPEFIKKLFNNLRKELDYFAKTLQPSTQFVIYRTLEGSLYIAKSGRGVVSKFFLEKKFDKKISKYLTELTGYYFDSKGNLRIRRAKGIL